MGKGKRESPGDKVDKGFSVLSCIRISELLMCSALISIVFFHHGSVIVPSFPAVALVFQFPFVEQRLLGLTATWSLCQPFTCLGTLLFIGPYE